MLSLFKFFLKKIGLKTYINKYIEYEIDRYMERKFAKMANLYHWKEALIEGKDCLLKHRDDGIKIYCYLDSKLSEYIYTQGFEESELTFVKKYLNEGDIFVDIGANIGLFTVIGAKAVGDSGSVYSFEPVSKNFHRLQANIDLNSLRNVKSFQLAFSDSVGQKEIAVFGNGLDAWSTLALLSKEEYPQTESINTTTINDFMIDYPDINKSVLVKVDVEGWEYYVLKGGHTLFSKDNAPVLMIEFTESTINRIGKTTRDLYQYLEKFGYQLFRYDEINNSLRDEPLKEYYPYDNLIAAKNFEEVTKRLGILKTH